MKTEVGFLKKRDVVMDLVKTVGDMAISSAADYSMATERLKDIREMERDLDAEYKQHPIILDAKLIQQEKKELSEFLENARKGLKNGPMRVYENEQERIRQEQERKQQEEARKAAEVERKRELAEQKAAWEKAEAARKAAAKRHDLEAEASAKADAEAIRQDAIEIRDAEIIAPVVVLPRAKTVPRKTVWRWKLTTVDGREFLKSDFSAATRIRANEVPGTPGAFFVVDPKSISAVVDVQGKNHGIPNIDAWAEEV